jgi:branched-chain amino acid transport system permease protein
VRALTQGPSAGAYITALLALNLGWGFERAAARDRGGRARTGRRALELRLESHYFALATLGIGQVMLLVAVQWQSVTGGANGLPGVPGIVLFGWTVPRGLPLAAFVWGLVAIGALLAWRLTRGLLGRAYTVMRGDIAAMSLGSTSGTRFVAFLLSAVHAGCRRALRAHDPRDLAGARVHVMVATLTMAVVGGRTGIAGAILGAFLLVHLPEWFRFLDKYYLIAYGAVLLAMIIAAPWGLVGGLERLRGRLVPEAAPRPPQPVPLVSRGRGAGGGPLLEVRDLAIAFGGVRALDGVIARARRDWPHRAERLGQATLLLRDQDLHAAIGRSLRRRTSPARRHEVRAAASRRRSRP